MPLNHILNNQNKNTFLQKNYSNTTCEKLIQTPATALNHSPYKYLKQYNTAFPQSPGLPTGRMHITTRIATATLT